MRILIDLNDPADVYLFSQVIRILQERGHTVRVTAREKEIMAEMLEYQGISYISRGPGGYSLSSKAWHLIHNVIFLIHEIWSFHPDILVGSHNMYLALAGRICKVPSVICADTEHDAYTRYLTYPFASMVLTPVSYRGRAGPRQVRYDGYHPLAYLHPRYYTPEPTMLEEFGLTSDDRFILLRLVSWKSAHNIGHSGIRDVRGIVNRLSPHARVLISAEEGLPSDLEPLRVRPARMPDLLYYATLVYGEGATISSEAAVLGTHAIYLDFAGRGYTDEQESRFGLVRNFGLDEESVERSLRCSEELLQNPDLWVRGKEKGTMLIESMIDVTDFLVQVIEGWPESRDTLLKRTC
ncbi:MAG TPA: DUF354 domain-containing protein [Methanospirillum sp.]|nr:DUF354 domain-containing protein [Methanospirillum sp.]